MSGVTLLNPSPPSCSKSADFLRGLTSRGFISEWRKSPGFPLSFAQLYLVARTLGIARRIEQRILQTVADYGLRDGIVYAYWMSQSCLGGVHAADKLGWPLVSRAHGGDLYTERYPGQLPALAGNENPGNIAHIHCFGGWFALSDRPFIRISAIGFR